MNARIRTELRLLLSACLLSAGACTKAPSFDLPAPVSQPFQPPDDGVLRAGFGRADITPPPGLGLMGYGPEGLQAIGYRQRLYARAMVLEDAAGERLGFVAVDLGQVSVLLHRRIAAAVMQSAGMGADRLILAATHTHAGPGHFFEVSAYNEYGSSVSGYDPDVVDFLVSRISAAVVEAAENLRPARIAWGAKDLWGVTRNRSREAFERNDPEWQQRFAPPPGVSPDSGGVDPTLTMLRVDVLQPGAMPETGPYRPAGALSVFAIHGTANPAGNRLYDSDIQAPVQRYLEAYIDSINGMASPYAPSALHLVANGTEGDNSPNLPSSTRTELPRLVRSARPGGPRSPPGYEEWRQPSEARQAPHIRQAREGIASLAIHMNERAVELFEELGSNTSADFRISRVFVAADMRASSTLRVCDPRNGTSSVAGAEDGPTRYRDWRLLGFVDVGFEEGGSAVNPDSAGCQGAKAPFLGPLYEVVADEQALPTTVQLTVARVGPVVVGAVPFEATAVTGGKLRDAIHTGAGIQGTSPDTVVLIGLANGYNSYVASEAEYGLQHYEGGSTLYGPKTGARLEELLNELGALLPPYGNPSPDVEVAPLTAHPGKLTHVFPSATMGPTSDRIQRQIRRAHWERDTLFVRWNDLHPGRFIPADGPVLKIERQGPAGWEMVTWDDDPSLEVRARKPAGGRGYEWEMRWSPVEMVASDHRVILLERPGLPEVVGDPIPPP